MRRIKTKSWKLSITIWPTPEPAVKAKVTKQIMAAMAKEDFDAAPSTGHITVQGIEYQYQWSVL